MKRIGQAAWIGTALVAGCAAPPPVATPAPKSEAPAAPPPASVAAPDVPAAHLTPDDIGVLPELGRAYRATLPMLGRALPLPEGSWQVVALQRSTFAGYPPGAQVMLLRAAGGEMTGAIEIAGNTLSNPAPDGWPVNPVCAAAARAASDPAVLAAGARGAVEGGAQDCFVIGLDPPASWRAEGAAPPVQALSRALGTLGVAMPAQTVLAAFGLTDAHHRLTEQVWLVPRSAEDAAAGSAYLRRVTLWAGQWRRVVQTLLSRRSARLAPGAGRLPS